MQMVASVPDLFNLTTSVGRSQFETSVEKPRYATPKKLTENFTCWFVAIVDNCEKTGFLFRRTSHLARAHSDSEPTQPRADQPRIVAARQVSCPQLCKAVFLAVHISQ